MTPNQRVQDKGFKNDDPNAWDGTYPRFVPTPKGWVVHLSKKAKIPGVYLSETCARKGYARYHGKNIEIELQRKLEKEAKKKAANAKE